MGRGGAERRETRWNPKRDPRIVGQRSSGLGRTYYVDNKKDLAAVRAETAGITDTSVELRPNGRNIDCGPDIKKPKGPRRSIVRSLTGALFKSKVIGYVHQDEGSPTPRRQARREAAEVERQETKKPDTQQNDQDTKPVNIWPNVESPASPGLFGPGQQKNDKGSSPAEDEPRDNGSPAAAGKQPKDQSDDWTRWPFSDIPEPGSAQPRNPSIPSQPAQREPVGALPPGNGSPGTAQNTGWPYISGYHAQNDTSKQEDQTSDRDLDPVRAASQTHPQTAQSQHDKTFQDASDKLDDMDTPSQPDNQHTDPPESPSSSPSTPATAPTAPTSSSFAPETPSIN